MTHAANIDRRDFLTQSAASLTLALTITADPLSCIGEAAADTPLAPNLWVTIATDGTGTIVSPPAEMGQGTFKTLAALLADTIASTLAMSTPHHPRARGANTYANPAFFRFLPTSARIVS